VPDSEAVPHRDPVVAAKCGDLVGEPGAHIDNQLQVGPAGPQTSCEQVKIRPPDADRQTVSVDLYRYPTLRRRLFGLLLVELRLQAALRSLRRVSAWNVALVVFMLLAILVHSWTALVLLAVLAALQVGMWYAEQRRDTLSGIRATDSLSGEQFENWLNDLFMRCGFEVEQTPFRSDFGADFVLTWNGIRTAVQAKSGHTRVGVNAVQQVVAARAFYRCERAMVVTNQYFTEQAVVLAEANKVVLRTRDDLMKKIVELRKDAAPAAASTS
jgi:restriction system protein